MRQVTWHWHSILIGHLHNVWSDSDSHSVATVKRVCYSAVAVGLHLTDKGFLLFWRTCWEEFILFSDCRVMALSPAVNTYLSILLNVDGAVVHSYYEEVMRVWIEQQREWRVSADVLGEEQRAGAWELIQVTVKRHCELICHQQSLVLWRETEWKRLN